jgi:hypothetical protein
VRALSLEQEPAAELEGGDAVKVIDPGGSQMSDNDFFVLPAKRRNLPPDHTTHGHSKGFRHTKVYSVWHLMVQRCTNPNCKGWKWYGSRGITVCDRWRSFENFLADMGEPPSPEHSIDRYPDNDGNYEPGNCRWATAKEQANNKRNNKLISYNGQTKTLQGWADMLGVKANTLNYRLRRGWTMERAFSQAIQKHTYASR